MEIKKSVGNRKDKSRSIKPINLHSDNMKEKRDNIQITNIRNGRDDITTVIKQIREYWELYVNKFNHLDKMEKFS